MPNGYATSICIPPQDQSLQMQVSLFVLFFGMCFGMYICVLSCIVMMYNNESKYSKVYLTILSPRPAAVCGRIGIGPVTFSLTDPYKLAFH